MVLETAQISALSFFFELARSRRASATDQVPMRLSKARATAMSLCRISKFWFTVMGSPMRTRFSAFLRESQPISMYKSVILPRLAVHALHVRWRITHHAEYGAFGAMHGYPLGLADNGVHAAHPFHENKAVVVDVIDRKGNLVSVAGQHNARSAAFVERGDAVAVFVVMGLIGELGNVIKPHALAAGFVAGGAGGVDEFFQKGEHSLRMGESCMRDGAASMLDAGMGFCYQRAVRAKLIADAKLVVVKLGTGI